MEKDNISEAAILRQKAEDLLKKKPSKPRLQLSEGEIQKLIHEFEVHQIELEIQNEELVLAKERSKLAAIEKATDGISEFAENIINTVREPLLVLDQDLRVVKASRSFYNFFKVTAIETIGKLIYDLGDNQWDIPKLRELLETILPQKTTFDDYEVEHNFSTIGRRVMLLNARQIKRAFGKEKIILLVIEDITERKLVEESLIEESRMTSEYLDILLDHTHAPIIIWDSLLVIKRFNHQFEKLSGYNSTEVIDRKIDILFPKDKIDSTLELLNNHLSDENSEVIEVDILTKSKDIKTVLWNSANILDKEGTSTVATIAHDITGQKRTETSLRESEERFRVLYENAKIGLYRTTPDGTILMANKVLLKMLGYSSFEKLAERNLEKSGFEQSYARKEFQEKIEKDGEINDFETAWVHQDGSVFFVRESARAIRDSQGITLYYDGMVEDITERKKAEDALLESEIKYRAFFENSMDAILLTSPDGKTLSANQASCTMFGYSEDELIRLGRSGIQDIADPRLSVLLEERKRNGKARGEVTLLRKDGTSFPAEISSAIFKNQEGLERTSMIIRDITVRTDSEKALRQSEEKFRSYIDHAPDGVLVVDETGRYIDVNNAACTMSGYSENELLKMSISDLLAEESLEDGLSHFNALIQKNTTSSELLFKHKDGSIRWWSLDAVKLTESRFLGFANDITERKRAEELLYVSREDLYRLLNSIYEGAYGMDINGNCTFVNRAFLQILGYQDEEEVLGKHIHELIHHSHCDGSPYPSGECRIYRAYQTNQTINVSDEVFWRKDGVSIPVEYWSRPIEKNGVVIGSIATFIDITERKHAEETLRSSEERYRFSLEITGQIGWSIPPDGLVADMPLWRQYTGQSIEEVKGWKWLDSIHPDDREHTFKVWANAIAQKCKYETEYRIRRADGVYRYFMVRGIPLFNTDGTFREWTGTCFDITERKHSETELIEAKNKAEESDRLKSAFLANMSHEVRTPLNSIIGFSGLLADPDFDEDQKNEFIQHIITNSNNLLTIISDIMDISKLESGEFKIRKGQIIVQKFISTVREQYAFQAKENGLELKLVLPEDTEETIIVADVERLRQIFNNLLSNALKFTANGRIEIGYEPRGKMVEFFVKDTGIGIQPEYHDKIFERFRQVDTEITRKFGGNGLGLAISKNIIELMGGKIRLESEPGKGSAFYFTLPEYTGEL